MYNFFVYVSKFVKMNHFLKQCNIKHTNFSNYINYRNYGAVDHRKLNDLYYQIIYSFDSAKLL